MTTDQSFDSVQTAIDREAKRRRRVLLTYLGLLIVPIIIGGFVLAKAPSETEAVAKQVTPIVRNEVAADIEPRITEAVTAKAEPLIRERVSREVRDSVDPKIAAATSGLKVNLTNIDREVKTLRVSVDAVPRHTQDLSAIRTEQTTFRNTVTRDAGVQKRDLQATQARLTRIENQLAALQSDVDKLTERLNRRQP